MPAQAQEVGCVQYQLEIEIDAPIEHVWQVLIEDTDGWWLPDYHMVGEDSRVVLDITPGGKGLTEYRPDGSFLQWYAVQSYLPQQHKLYLVGNLAPEFGGPSTSNLGLALEPRGQGCVLQVSDAHFGRVDERTVDSLRSGWQQLFENGLRDRAESTVA